MNRRLLTYTTLATALLQAGCAAFDDGNGFLLEENVFMTEEWEYIHESDMTPTLLAYCPKSSVLDLTQRYATNEDDPDAFGDSVTGPALSAKQSAEVEGKEYDAWSFTPTPLGDYAAIMTEATCSDDWGSTETLILFSGNYCALHLGTYRNDKDYEEMRFEAKGVSYHTLDEDGIEHETTYSCIGHPSTVTLVRQDGTTRDDCSVSDDRSEIVCGTATWEFQEEEE